MQTWVVYAPALVSTKLALLLLVSYIAMPSIANLLVERFR